MGFSVRVYGLLLNDQQEILIADETENGYAYTKFPGGGLEFGEGLREALKREFMEECSTTIEIVDHFYTTDMFVLSSFDDKQLISVYYYVRLVGSLNCSTKESPFDFDPMLTNQEAFRWVKVDSLSLEDLTFPVDKHVLGLLKSRLGYPVN